MKVLTLALLAAVAFPTVVLAQVASVVCKPAVGVSVIECFETDGGVNYRSDRLI